MFLFNDFTTALKLKIKYTTKIFESYKENKEQRTTFGDEPSLTMVKSCLEKTYDDYYNEELPEKKLYPIDIEGVADISSCDTTTMFFLRTFSNPYMIDEDGNTYQVVSYTDTSITTNPIVPSSVSYVWTAFYFFNKSKVVKYITSYIKEVLLTLEKVKT